MHLVLDNMHVLLETAVNFCDVTGYPVLALRLLDFAPPAARLPKTRGVLLPSITDVLSWPCWRSVLHRSVGLVPPVYQSIYD